MSTNPEKILNDVADRYQAYLALFRQAQDANRPSNEEIAGAIKAGLEMEMPIGKIAERLGMHRVQMYRDFGHLWASGNPDAA